MKERNRRDFLIEVGLGVGAVAFGRQLFATLAVAQDKPGRVLPSKAPPELPAVVDFRYAPADWQSTFCFPDDPAKSLVGRDGTLLYGHPGIGADLNAFAHRVRINLRGAGNGTFAGQSMASPGVPVVTTKLEFPEHSVTLVCFATSRDGEGRVDNLLVEVTPKGSAANPVPEIVIDSQAVFSASTDDDRGVIRVDGPEGRLFCIVSAPVTQAAPNRFELAAPAARRFVMRFPQSAQQEIDMEDAEDLRGDAERFWGAWKPTAGQVTWNLPGAYGDFFTASVRNMQQAREIKNGKKIFQVGPTVYRGLWYIDGTFLLEAARYAGFDAEAQDGLEAIWNMQQPDGSFKGGAGERHWKDTAAAVYMLVRQAELTQNWEFFDALYPDAIKAVMYLRDLQQKAINDGTSNGRYKLLPQGFGDSGIGGIRPELANTLWTMIALKPLLEIADRKFLPRRPEVREFYGDLRRLWYEMIRDEARTHPNGFKYLPLLLKDDPRWNDPDERKRPRPQAAQIYMSQAIYPGLLFEPNDWQVTGHIELMKAVTQEDIPAETGWLTDRAVWSYNGAVAAQVYLWAFMPELARKTFIGFLNHASPMLAWREEQSLRSVPDPVYIGDMPHNWASAECVRYLRHMLILEDSKTLRLLDGLGIDDLAMRRPMAITSSPTRWGRVSVTLEPVDDRSWSVTFRREGMNPDYAPKLTWIEMPRHLPGNFQFDRYVGSKKAIKNGMRLLLDPEETACQCIFTNFSRKK